jgi:hypothetical protein
MEDIMLELRKPIPPELMEALIRHARDERAATVAAMLKRIPFLVAAAFQALLCLTGRKRPLRRNARPIAYPGLAPTGH